MIHTLTESVPFRRLVRAMAAEHQCSLELGWVHAMARIEGLIHLAIRDARRGDIGRLEDIEIADALRWPGPPERLVAMLIDAGFLAADPEYRLVLIDWHNSAPGFIKKNIGRAGGFVTGSPEPERESDSAPASSPEPGSDTEAAQQSQNARTPNRTRPNRTEGLIDDRSIDHARKDQNGRTGPPRIDPADVAELRVCAADLAERLGGHHGDPDWRLAVRVTHLARHVLGEHWLFDAIAAVDTTHPRNKWGLAHDLWKKSAAKAGYDFERLKKQVGLPKALQLPPTPDGDERLTEAASADERAAPHELNGHAR